VCWKGGSDEEILEWCYQNGRRLNEGDILVWNNFSSKFGWNDFATPTLERRKKRWVFLIAPIFKP
jgi:hypothetical protein